MNREHENVFHRAVSLDYPPTDSEMFMVNHYNEFINGDYKTKTALWKEAGMHPICRSLQVYQNKTGDTAPLYIFDMTPTNQDDREFENQWYREYIEENNYNFELKCNEIESILEKHGDNNLTKIKFLKNELSDLEKKINFEFPTNSPSYKIFSNYELSRIEPNWREVTRTTVDNFVYAKYVVDLRQFLELKIKEIENPELNRLDIRKLKWNCSPSILGHLITELAKKGYIEYPLFNGDPNYTGMGRLCSQIFEIEGKESNFIRECNPNLNSLSITKKSKFDCLPDLKDLI